MDIGGGIRQWAKQRKREYIEGEGENEGIVIKRAMGWKVRITARLRRGKGIGCGGRIRDVGRKISYRRVEDARGRREWVGR